MVTDLDHMSEGTGAQPPTGRSLLSRIRLGHVVMVLAALFAMVFNLAVLRGDDAMIEVVVAVTDIRAGTMLTATHFDLATVPADELLSARFVRSTEMEAAVGQLTIRSIASGDPVLHSDLLTVNNRNGLRAMSVPIDQSRAVSGQLARGDSVDIVLVSEGVATYIASNVEVLEVPQTDMNALGAQTGYAPTLAVDAEQALLIASALDLGDVHIIRSTGSALPDLEQATAFEASDEGQSG